MRGQSEKTEREEREKKRTGREGREKKRRETEKMTGEIVREAERIAGDKKVGNNKRHRNREKERIA